MLNLSMVIRTMDSLEKKLAKVHQDFCEQYNFSKCPPPQLIFASVTDVRADLQFLLSFPCFAPEKPPFRAKKNMVCSFHRSPRQPRNVNAST